MNETSKASMEEFLDYLYTGHVDISRENANELFALADYFLISSLKALSGKFTNSVVDATGDTAKYPYCTEVMKTLNHHRRNGHFCDVILEVVSDDDQARLKAHRNVLCASSPFFCTALQTVTWKKRKTE